MTKSHRNNHGTTLDHARDDAAQGHGAADIYAQGRAKAADAGRRAAQGLDANPLGVLVGGIAVGALVGALVPRSVREKEMLAPVGRRLGETARAAVQAAKDAGYAELDQRGLTPGAAKDQARGMIDGLAKAASSAGNAAVKGARTEAEG